MYRVFNYVFVVIGCVFDFDFGSVIKDVRFVIMMLFFFY